jgi:hypothetical protein
MANVTPLPARAIKWIGLTITTLLSSIVYAQSPSTLSPRKDIPTIARGASGSVVSIVMSDKDGKPIAQGSGFLVSRDGLIVTNYHVISAGTSGIVKLPDGAFYVVEGVFASDKARDIAVIKAHGQNFRALALGDSDQVQVGEEVVAIGNPLSLESTVSNGIVSGIRRDERIGSTFLQVTTPISPGSSGGPLFNMAGEVIGITSMYLQGGENLNFAIAVNDAKRLFAHNSTELMALPNEAKAQEAHKQDKDAPAHESTQPPPNPTDDENSRAQTARNYFNELKNADTFNRYSDEYVCFADSDAPSFAVMSTTDSILQRMKRNGEKISKEMAQEMKGGLAVQTYFKGVANKVIVYDEQKEMERADNTYSIEFGSPFKGKMVYKINWITGRYRLQVFAANKAVPASEASGKCELIHPDAP